MLRLWALGLRDALLQALGRNPAPRGHSGGLASPLLETLRTGHAARWVEGTRVLDIGCGRARLLPFLPQNVEYVGVEENAELLEYLSEHRASPRTRFLHADAFGATQPGDETPFDTIVLAAVIEHLARPAEVIRSLARRLRAGGVLVLTTPAPRFETLLEAGARVGLFDRGAEQDHKSLLDRRALTGIVEAAGLHAERYDRFLFGGNQLMVARKPRSA